MALHRLLMRLGSQKRRDVHVNGDGEVDSSTRRSKTLPVPTVVVDRKEQSASAATTPNPNPNPSSEPPTSSPAILQSNENGNNSTTIEVTNAKEASGEAGKEAVATGVMDGATSIAITKPLIASTEPLQTASELDGLTNVIHSPGDGSSVDDSPLTAGEIRHIEDGPQLSHKEVAMNEAVDTLEVPVNMINRAQISINNYDPQADSIQAVETDIRGLSEGLPILMKALDECSKAHPFIAVAVLAFRAAYALEMKRRDNDRKILALFVEMRDMMSVLRQLSTLPDTQLPATNGTSTASRLETLCHQTAADIRSCSNTCDTYNRKRLIVKCLAGPVWEARLGTYVALFTKRREEFLFAMSVRTTLGMDDVGKTVKDIEAVQREANERMGLLIVAFQRLVSPEQKQMLSLIDKHGGAGTVKTNDKALQQLLKESSHLTEKGEEPRRPTAEATIPAPSPAAVATISSSGSGTAGNTAQTGGAVVSSANQSVEKPLTTEALRSELTENIEFVLTKNMELFQRKFEVQKRQITEDLAKVVGREGDRIVAAVTTGPHDRILDPDMHAIWKDMGWKGSVKAKHFVFAVRDYFFEKTHKRKHQVGDNTEALSQESEDLWAVQFLDLHCLQPISEAIDDDSSGFVTVEELNLFTSARPLDWSLIKWLAFWAVGFNMVLFDQRDEIITVLDKMFSLLPLLLPENRIHARTYLYCVWERVATTIYSLGYGNGKRPGQFLEKIRDYVRIEEDRIRKNLAGVSYRIDEVETLYLITGPGRIEKNYFPLVKLLLERHLQIFQIGRTKILHRKELEDAYLSFIPLDKVIEYRLRDLKAICANHGTDFSQSLKTFAHGIYEYHTDPKMVWGFDRLVQYDFSDTHYDFEEPFDDSNYPDLLNRGEGKPNTVNTSVYELGPAYHENDHKPDRHPLCGAWHCLVYHPEASAAHPYRALQTVTFEMAETQPEDGSFAFTCSGALSMIEVYTITGTCRRLSGEEDKYSMSWVLQYVDHEYDDQFFIGTFDKGAMKINGTVGRDPDAGKHTSVVFLSIQSADVLMHRPPPYIVTSAPMKLKIPALWRYALDATMYEVRKKRWSWSYFRDRRDNRKKFLDLVTRDNWFYKPLSSEEVDELCVCKRMLYPADYVFLTSIELQMANTRVQVHRVCDCCFGKLATERIVCLECKPNSIPFSSLDVCNDQECMSSEVARADLDKPHLPYHRAFKTRQFLVIRDFGRAWKTAVDACSRGDKAITDALASYGEERAHIEWKDTEYPEKERSISAEQDDLISPPGKVADDRIVGSNAVVDTLTVPLQVPSEASAHPAPTSSEPSAGIIAVTLNSSSTPAESMEPRTKPANTDIEAQIDNATTPTASGREGARSISELGPDPKNLCYHCLQKLSSPCWYCIDCKDTVLICMHCDPPGGFDKGEHKWDHTLLKVSATAELDEDPNEDDKVIGFIKALETKFDGNLGELQESLTSLRDSVGALQGGIEARDKQLDIKIASLDDRFDERLRVMEDRFSRVEGLLEKLLSQNAAIP